jgi:hypothetical protein
MSALVFNEYEYMKLKGKHKQNKVHTLTKQSWKCTLMSAAASDGAFGICS